jgi:hypothetical protein
MLTFNTITHNQYHYSNSKQNIPPVSLWVLHLELRAPPSLEMSEATHTVWHPRKFKSSKTLIYKWLVLKCNQRVPITFEAFGRPPLHLQSVAVLLHSDRHLYSKTKFKQKLHNASLHVERRTGNCWFGSHRKGYCQTIRDKWLLSVNEGQMATVSKSRTNGYCQSMKDKWLLSVNQGQMATVSQLGTNGYCQSIRNKWLLSIN